MLEIEPQTDMALYEYMFNRKWEQGWSWLEISDALQLGLNNNSTQKKFRRLADKVNKPYKPEKVELKSKRILEKPKEKETILEIETEGLSDDEIDMIPYGEIPPTGFISDLIHDDWSEKYLVFDDYYIMTEEEILECKKEWRLEYLSELRRRIWDENELMVLLPRGYAKTETVIGLFVRWFNEIKLPIYIITPSNPHSEDILNRIESHLHAPAIRRDYGDIAGKSSRGKQMMLLYYHESIKWTTFDRPISLVTFAGGKKGKHPAWIHLEDVMQDEAVSEETNQRIKKRFNSTYRLMRRRHRNGKKTKMTATGTRYGMLDMYHYLIESHGFNLLHYKALISETEMLDCPNYIIEDLLESKRIDPASFETEMQNNPIPSSGVYFSDDEWVSVKVGPQKWEGTVYYMAMDPARGMSEGADNTAILVLGILNGIGTVVDGFVGKIDDDEKVKYINQFHLKYNPAFTLIEKTFAQIDMRRFSNIRGLIPYQDTSTNAKIMRINAMKSYYIDSLLQVVEGIQPYDFLYNEYLSYNEKPSTVHRKDDALDAKSMIVQQFGDLLNKYTDQQVTWEGDEEFYLTSRE